MDTHTIIIPNKLICKMDVCFLNLGSRLISMGTLQFWGLTANLFLKKWIPVKEFSFDASIVCVFEAKRLASKMHLKFAIHFGSPEFVFPQEAMIKKNAKLLPWILEACVMASFLHKNVPHDWTHDCRLFEVFDLLTFHVEREIQCVPKPIIWLCVYGVT